MLKVLARDSFYYFIGSIFTQVAGLMSLIVIMRSITVTEYGIYSYAVTFVALFSFIADGGFSQYAIKEIAQNAEKKAAIYQIVQSAQVVVSISVLTILLITAVAFNTASDFFNIAILGIGVVITGFLTPIFNVFIAEGKKGVIVRRDILLSLTRLVFTVAVGVLSPSVRSFALVNLTLALITLAYCWCLKRDNAYSFLLRFRFAKHEIKTVIIGALPFTLLVAANVLYNKIDVIMLKHMSDETQVGLYAGATQFVYPFMFVSTVLVTAIFPHMSRNVGTASAFKDIQYKSLLLMSAAGLLISSALYFGGEFFYRFLLSGKYDASLDIYRVLVWYLFIVFTYGVFSNTMVAKGLVRQLFLLNLIGLVVNIVFNYIFIPTYGAVAAAYITLGCEIFLLISISYYALTAE